MRFLYRYQDREKGVVEAELAAPSEPEAYAILRKSGIRPMKVWAKPGMLNALSRIGKRGWTIVALAVVVVIVTVKLLQVESVASGGFAEGNLRPLQRGQVPCVAVDFKFKSEKVLALFARPGEVTAEMDGIGGAALDDLPLAVKSPIRANADDPADVVQLKRVVVGLKDEARMALASGLSPSAFLNRLLERQRMEAAYRKSVVDELRSACRSMGAEAFRKRLKAVNDSFSLTGLKGVENEELKSSKTQLTDERVF